MHGSTSSALSCGCIGIGLNCFRWMKSTSFASGKVTWRIGTPASDALFSSQLKLGGFAWQMAEKLHSNLESIFKLKFLMCFGLPKKGTNNKKVLILKLYSVIKTSFGMIEAPTYLLIQS